MFKGVINRIKKEIEYLIAKDWSLQDVANHWDETFDYDDINKETYSYFRRFIDGYRLAGALPEKSYILDICCRTGNGSLYFWQNNKISKVVCADVSKQMLAICRDRLKASGVPFEICAIDDYQLPFGNKQFDAILCLETVEHISHPGVFIKELSRVTKSGGQMILSTPNILWEPIHSLAAIFNIHHSEGPHRFLGRGEIRKYLASAGFDIVNEETTVLIPVGPKMLVKLGEAIERRFRHSIMPFFGLRRFFICKKR